MTVVYLLVAVVAALITVFAIQNISPVPVHFLVWQLQGALSLVILLSVLVGVVLTSLFGLVRHWKLRARIRQLEGRLAELSAAEAPRTDQAPH